MKEFLERFGLTEVLAHLFPGAIVLSCLLVWFEPKLLMGYLGDIGKNDFLTGTILVIASYTLGLLIGMYGRAGAELSRRLPRALIERKAGAWMPTLPVKGIGAALSFIFLWIIVWMFVRVPSWTAKAAAIDAGISIAEPLERYYGALSMLLAPTLGDQLVLFRTIAADRLAGKGIALLSEADTAYRRRISALGLALALMFVALTCFVRVLLDSSCPRWVIGSIGLGTMFGSFLLRHVANQWYQSELMLTLGVLRGYRFEMRLPTTLA